MYCFNCGRKVDSSNKFCPGCGADLASRQAQNNNYNVYDNSGNDEELLKAFIGEKYDYFKNHSFNFPALFITPLYLLYRKCYLYFLIYIVLLLFPYVNFIGIIIYSIVMGVVFNNMYLKKANDEIVIIKNQNPSALREQLLQLVAQKGGTNIAGPIIYLVITILIIVALIILVLMLFSGIRNFTNNLVDEEPFTEYFDDYFDDEKEYDSYFSTCEYNKDDIKNTDGHCYGVIKDMLYNVPNKYYTLEEYKTDEIGKYKYTYGSTSLCTFEVTTITDSVENYKASIDNNPNNWIKRRKGAYEYESYSKETYDEAGKTNIDSYYVINRDNNTYTLSFSDYDDGIGKCSEIREQLFKKIDFLSHNSNDSNIA